MACPRIPSLTSLLAHAARRATNDDKMKLINSVDCFIFDCDGGLGLWGVGRAGGARG